MPFSKDAILHRVGRLREAMHAAELDAVVVYAAPAVLQQVTSTSGNVRYLTNWAPSHTLRHSLLFLPLVGDPVLFVHYPIFPACEQDLWVTDIRADKSSASTFRTTGTMLSERGYARVG